MKPTVFKNQLKIARIFFIIAALYGLYMRFSMVFNISIKYKYIVEAHSHIAFLGWGFLATISLTGFVFYPKILQTSKKLKQLFLVMLVAIIGMLVSFSFQGYHLFSIVFLILFLVTSYVYLFHILKILKSIKTQSSKFIKTGIFYYYLSSIAVWLLPLILKNVGKTDLYHNAIYFYLHFLYNGFFVFLLFGMLIKYLEDNKLNNNKKHIRFFYTLTHITCIPAYSLSILWANVPSFTYYIAFITSVLQVISLIYLFKIQKVFLKTVSSKFIKIISTFVITSYFIKIMLQFLSVFPYVLNRIVPLKSYFIIGYLHLFTLGFMSLFIILLIYIHPKVLLNKLGVSFLMIGIFLSELFLFLQGFLILYFKGIAQINLILFVVSICMPLGILIIHFKLLSFNNKK